MGGEPVGNPKDVAAKNRVPMTLLPPSAAIEVAAVMRFGAEKYGPYNWRTTPIDAMVYIDAALRHLAAYVDGENAASDSGLSHISHAASSLCILIDAIACGTARDNRPAKGQSAMLLKSHSGE